MKNLALVPDVSAPPEGRLLHYELLARLGAGGFGDVYEAWDTQLQRKVAIKRLRTQGARPRANGLLREARMAASLRHPAFVQIHAIEEDAEGHAIVMELVRGLTWRDIVDAERPPLATALDMVAQLARAMQAAHGAGLVHGDLKPSNIMREPDGRVRILDLGLAFYEDRDATSSAIPEQQGTIAYMAPECLLGAKPTRQSDVYAAGVILYELATGDRPYGAMTGLALAAAQLQSSSAQWTFPPYVPADVADLVRAMTARDPGRRMTGMRDVVRVLEARVRCDGPASGPALRTLMDTPWRRWRALGEWRGWRMAFAVASMTVLLASMAWHGGQRPWTLAQVSPRFSTVASVGAGLKALRQPDRPDRLDAAAAQFEAVLVRDPDNAAAAAGLSLVASFRYAGDTQDETWLQRAAAAAQQALKRDSQLALAHVAQAWVLSRTGPNAAALAEAERALALDPGDFFAAVGKAMFLTKLRRFDTARRWIAEASARHPDERLLADALGTLYYTEGNYAAAEKAFRDSIRLAPDSVFAYANLNAVLLHENRRDEALGVLQQGLRIRPSGVLYTNLGNALFQRGDYSGAVDAFRQAVTPPAGNPNSYLAWANLADALLWIPGRAGPAREAYEQAMQLLAVRLLRTPDDVMLVSRMSLYKARVGAPGDSIALLKRALQLAPSDAYVHFRAGLAYELLGQRTAALAEIGEARSLGYPASKIETEPDLVSLRHDARYQSPPTKE